MDKNIHNEKRQAVGTSSALTLHTDKEGYRILCEGHPEIPLFAQHWWMEAVCDGKPWDALLVRNAQGEIIAAMPYMLIRKLWMKIILQPVLSQTNGILFFRATEEEKTAVCNLIIQHHKKLRIDWFMQYFDRGFSPLQPFEKEGYKVTQQPTYIVRDIQQEDVLHRFSSAQQRQVRKAQRNQLSIHHDMTPEAFYDFHCATLAQRGRKNLHSREKETRLIREAIRRNAGTILSVQDPQQQIHATLFLVWDQHTAYYLIPAFAPQFKTSGASAFLIYQAINHIKERCQVFDFEGSRDPNIARFYQQFGSEKTEYPKIEKRMSLVLRVLGGFV